MKIAGEHAGTRRTGSYISRGVPQSGTVVRLGYRSIGFLLSLVFALGSCGLKNISFSNHGGGLRLRFKECDVGALA